MLLPELQELNDACSLSSLFLSLLFYFFFRGKKRLRNCTLKGREKKKPFYRKEISSLRFMDLVDYQSSCNTESDTCESFEYFEL